MKRGQKKLYKKKALKSNHYQSYDEIFFSPQVGNCRVEVTIVVPVSK
jgi:hypothetical protein